MLTNNVICTFCLAKCIRKGGGGNCSFWLHDVQKDRYLYFLPYKMHQKRTKKLFLLTTWRMALFTKRAFFWFLSERHLSRKERHLYFLPCQMHHKRTTKLFLLTTWRSKRTLFVLFFLAKCIRKGQKIVPFDYMTFKKNVICTFSLTKCIRKGQKNCSFWLHEEWLSPQKEQLLCSFLNVIFLEKKVICTFCLAKCIRKGQNNCSFWLHEEWLSPQKEQLLCSFLNVIFLEKNVICIFCLAKCIIKGKQIVPFDYMTFKKNVICTFFPYKMHQKRKKNCSFWLHEEWLSSQKEHFLFLSECHLSRKEGHLYFLPCQMHQKRTKKIVPFDYMKNGSLHKIDVICTFCLAKCHQKRETNCSFWLHDVQKNIISTFCLAKYASEKDKNIVPFDYMMLKKERHLYFLPCQICIRKGTKTLFLLTTWRKKKHYFYFLPCQICIRKGQITLFLLTAWRMALSTKRAIFLFLS